jgi:hypothetical protein
MERNDTPDRFEDFLKKALEHYEEQPADTAWAHIAARMPVREQPPPTMWYQQKRLQVTAALLFLLFSSLLVWKTGQIFGALQRAEANILQKDAQLDTLSKTVDGLEESLVRIKAQAQQTAQASQFVANQTAQSSEALQPSEAIGKMYQSRSEQRRYSNQRIIESQTSGLIEQTNPIQGSTQRAQLLQPVLTLVTQEPVSNQAEITQTATRVPQTVLETKADQSAPNQLSLGRLPNAPLSAVRSTMPAAHLLLYNHPTLVAAKSKHLMLKPFVGVHGAKQSVEPRTGRPGRPDYYASQKYQNTNQVTEMGIFVESDRTGRWEVRVGIGLTQIESEAMHDIKIRPLYHGGGPGGGGHQQDSLAFTYTIQTGTGLADVELRAIDHNGGMQQHKDDVEIKLQTREKAQYLTLPVGVSYPIIKKRRLQVSALGGLALYLPTRREIQINKYELNAPFALMPEPQNRQRAKMRTDGPAPVHAAWQAGMELSCTLNNQLAVTVTPQISRKANRALEQGWADHRYTSIGVQMGLAYRL